NNYICHFTCFDRRLTDRVGGFREGFDGSQDHDLMLRLSSAASAIVHVPKVLYYWRAHSGSAAMSTDAKDYASDAGRRAVQSSLTDSGCLGSVECIEGMKGFYRIKYELTGTPRISIIIPSSDQTDKLRTCVESILGKSTYPDYEIIIAENNSRLPGTFEYYRALEKDHSNIKVIRYEGPFNYAAVNNYCVKEKATGEYVLLLNNDTEVITPDWMEEMMMYAQRKDVGAVGAKLYYPDGTIQHAGVVIGLGGIAGHIFAGVPGDSPGYMGKLGYAQDMSAVTGACMLVKKDIYLEVGGMDTGYALAFNDVDLCMRIRRAGYLIVWTPFAELYHYESATRGIDDTPDKKERFIQECDHFRSIWNKELSDGDPYYNSNLSLSASDYSMR
ncbi:MAG: glycosyltransferase family 2 protein, partial [Lachnospiraceae bacterium]|nr:glycosyltransferase family 2 protein [Lachnospiraceae bacterium]